MARKLLLSLLFFCGTAFAQQTPASFFQGDVLPTPPQQNKTWQHGDDPLSKAAATLFDQGLADPRGLEYREIEIAVGNPWTGGGYACKTHGWVLPDNGKNGRFAVAWNGLVYPAVSIGNIADLHKDWAQDDRALQDSGWQFVGASEGRSVGIATPSALKLVMLLRLGEVETVERISKVMKLDDDSDPYLKLANDWAWFAFDRAVCAHERGDDRLALADARLLTRIQPLVEAEAKRRGIAPPPNYSDSRLPPGPYLSSLGQLPALLADSERRLAERKKQSLVRGDIASMIDDLQNVDARQWAQPGGVSLAQDARIQALVKRGNEIVEPLLATMENDTRLTRSVSFGRDFHRSRNLIPVSNAAYAALVDLMQVNFNVPNGPLPMRDIAASIRSYWAKFGNLSPAERSYETLKDDKAGKDQWLQAAAYIIQPTDVESHGGWTTVPTRKPGQKIELRGESLRDGRTPSVSQLMATRSDDIASFRTNSSGDHFLYIDAGNMALYLARWDGTAAVPTLKKRLTRAWDIGREPYDILASNGNPVEHFGTIIAKMTSARAQAGDEAAYDEYADWIRRVELKGVPFGQDELQKPLIEGQTRSSIAAATDYLFNDPRSPWSDVLAPGNGYWLTKFWQSSLSTTSSFRKQALHGLGNNSLAGTITFNPRPEWQNRSEAQIVLGTGFGMGFRGSDGDPDTPPPGEKRAFRVSDAYAYFYSTYQNGPKFQLFWSQAKRDAGVLACRKWLGEKK